MNLILICLLWSFTIIVVRHLPSLLSNIFERFAGRKKKYIVDWYENLIALIMIFVLSLAFFSVVKYVDDQQSLFYTIAFALLFVSFLVNYNFFVIPILILVRKSKFPEHTAWRHWIEKKFGEKVNVRLMKEDMTNAFATGLFSFSKLIIIGEPVLKKMNEDEQRCILLHEYAHLKFNHLRVMYIVVLAYAFIMVLWYILIEPHIIFFEDKGANIAAHGALLGSFQFFFYGFFQKRTEYEADLFAASQSGKKSYVQMLNKLNEITDKALDRYSFSHPTLRQRIQHIEANL